MLNNLCLFFLKKDPLHVHFSIRKICLFRILIFVCQCLFFSLCSCSYVVKETVAPEISSPSSYTLQDASDDAPLQKWWTTFDDPLLNDLIHKILSDNFTLKQGAARINQAYYIQKQTASLFYPQLESKLSGSSTWFSGESQENNNALSLDLSWEIDLWGKLSSADKAALYEIDADMDAVEALALLLSSQTADTYFHLIEQKLQDALLNRQIKVNETFLDLIKLRFANGAASVVDVYQQRQLLAADQAKRPLIKAQIATLQNRLYVLMGMAPKSISLAVADQLPSLPPTPPVGIPANLLRNRPDLRSLHKKLLAADHRVAEAVADRLPQITIGGSGGLLNGNLFLTLFGDAFASIINWGNLKSEVEKRKAIVQEIMADYSQKYITAIEEVENALTQEKYYINHMKALDNQLTISKANLQETRNRYMQGLTDYLPVLSALVSLQDLERDMLTRNRQLISIRLLLYRALGGTPILDNFPPKHEKLVKNINQPQSTQRSQR